ncbi:uncharacterized protein PFL1_05301 [Pseudozyma flocculosa PF-1]|uniref:Uncharacterized protein n=2 Tax=Pseudozyma flocculosa TaxID=84751 RepID=A0A5C3FC39_9BASI|nr:uncharacterized protein PFL1_05301 [Pseudozyma flocculosa PF-1]EPQ27017.1 hypothetical protein PFL1_05301 [Pseudozyma flocculosa PF-1]SPO42013.1 uncharacterized protein PSFLO_07496 [Pseudozyma flocculosa]
MDDQYVTFEHGDIRITSMGALSDESEFEVSVCEENELESSVLLIYPDGTSSHTLVIADAVLEYPPCASGGIARWTLYSFSRSLHGRKDTVVSLGLPDGVDDLIWHGIQGDIAHGQELVRTDGAGDLHNGHAWYMVGLKDSPPYTYIGRDGEIEKQTDLLGFLDSARSSLLCDVGVEMTVKRAAKEEAKCTLQLEFKNVHVQGLSDASSNRHILDFDIVASRTRRDHELLRRIDKRKRELEGTDEDAVMGSSAAGHASETAKSDPSTPA